MKLLDVSEAKTKTHFCKPRWINVWIKHVEVNEEKEVEFHAKISTWINAEIQTSTNYSEWLKKNVMNENYMRKDKYI